MNRIFIDMDGVIVDFEGYMAKHDLTASETKTRDSAYRDMKPIDGAIQAVRSLISMGFDVWIATKPPTGVAGVYSDKASWIFSYLPELEAKLIITPDKGLLGDDQDYLCDDRPHKASCEEFAGTLLHFSDDNHWPEVLEHFESLSEKPSLR